MRRRHRDRHIRAAVARRARGCRNWRRRTRPSGRLPRICGPRGRKLTGTIIAVADQLAAAAGILMRKPAGCPVVLLRGFDWKPAEGSARSLIRSPEQDLFR